MDLPSPLLPIAYCLLPIAYIEISIAIALLLIMIIERKTSKNTPFSKREVLKQKKVPAAPCD